MYNKAPGASTQHYERGTSAATSTEPDVFATIDPAEPPT